MRQHVMTGAMIFSPPPQRLRHGPWQVTGKRISAGHNDDNEIRHNPSLRRTT